MNQKFSTYQLSDNTIFFTDTLHKNSPYIATEPRNHESIFLVTNGTMVYEKQGRKTIIKTGQIGYVERGSMDISAAYLCESVSYVASNFSFDNENLFPTLPFNSLCSRGYAYNYEPLFQDALRYYLLKSPGYRSLCNGLLMQIIGLLYNEHETHVDIFKKSNQIEAALLYLTQNYHSADLTISHLADVVAMSEKNFRRIFHEVYGQTPYQFLQKFRIDKAKILLSITTKNISDVAFECGFSDIYSFSHCFKKHTGISPSQYRINVL